MSLWLGLIAGAGTLGAWAQAAPALEPFFREGPLGIVDPQAVPEERTGAEALYDSLIRNRLSVGIRRSRHSHKETLRPEDPTRTETFLGYIHELIPENRSETGLVVGYEFLSVRLTDAVSLALGGEYSHGEVAARTLNFNNLESDGIVRMSGPLYGITLQVRILEFLAPYLGIGYAPWKSEFEHEEWWNLGYASEDAYNRLGRPGIPRNGYRRVIEVKRDSSRFLTYGVAVRLHRNVEIDLMMRQLDLNAEAFFYQEYDGFPHLDQTGSFPMSHKTYGVSLKVVF